MQYSLVLNRFVVDAILNIYYYIIVTKNDPINNTINADSNDNDNNPL